MPAPSPPRRSAALTQGPHRAPARAMLKAVGFTDEDLAAARSASPTPGSRSAPATSTSATWPSDVKRGHPRGGRHAARVQHRRRSPTASRWAPQGMKASLVSREVIADSIELVARGNHLDGARRARAAATRPSPAPSWRSRASTFPGIVLYGGSIAPGHCDGRDVTIQDVFEAVGAHAAGRMTDERAARPRERRLPGRRRLRRPVHRQHDGHGLRVPRHLAHGQRQRAGRRRPAKPDVARADRPRSSWIWSPATCARAGSSRAPPSRTRSPASMATGGSTNAVLHLLAIAREAGVPLSIDDFNRVSDRMPLIADLKPGGRFVATDLHRAGGIQLVAQAAARGRPAPRRRDHRHRPHASARKPPTPPRRPGRRSCGRCRRPIKPTGGLVILQGQPRARGLRGQGGRLHAPGAHAGPARVFDSEEAAFAAVQRGSIKPGDVVVIRYEGPAGGPGMREMLGGHGRARRRRPGRLGRAAHRRPLLRRHARADGRPRRARGRARRADRRRARRRPHHVRHRRARHDCEVARAGRRTARAAWRRGRPRRRRFATGVHGEVRPARVVGLRRAR